jgi:hypothetical protein
VDGPPQLSAVVEGWPWVSSSTSSIGRPAG